MMKIDPEAWLNATKGTTDEILAAKRSKDALKGQVTRQTNILSRFADTTKKLIEDLTAAAVPHSTAATLRREAAPTTNG